MSSHHPHPPVCVCVCVRVCVCVCARVRVVAVWWLCGVSIAWVYLVVVYIALHCVGVRLRKSAFVRRRGRGFAGTGHCCGGR